MVTARDAGVGLETPPASINITLRRNDAAPPPTWEPVGGQDLDFFTLHLDENVGPNITIEPTFSVAPHPAELMDFILPTGFFPESNNDDQFRVKTEPRVKPTMRLVKRAEKQTGGRDRLRYIKLRALVGGCVCGCEWVWGVSVGV